MRGKKPSSSVPEEKGPRQEHDPSYKRFFSTPRMVRDLLEGFVPGALLRLLDLDSLEKVPGSFVGRHNRQRHSDVIWRVRWSSTGEWLFLYLLIEFQSRPEKFMPVRMMSYLGLFYQDLIRANPDLLREEARLPAVLPIVVYNGKPRWPWPVRLSELLEPLPREYRRLQPECSFLLLDEGGYTEEELRARADNFVALLFRLERIRRGEEADVKVTALREQLGKPGNEEIKEAYRNWFYRVLNVRFPALDVEALLDSESETMLAETIDGWFAEAEKRVRRSHKEGQIQASQDLILTLLEDRFGKVPMALASRIKALQSLPRLKKLARQVVAVRAIDELEVP